MRIEKDKEVKEAREKADAKFKQKIEENNKMIQMLQKRVSFQVIVNRNNIDITQCTTCTNDNAKNVIMYCLYTD